MTTTNETNQATFSGPVSIGTTLTLLFFLDDDDDLKIYEVVDLTKVATAMVKGVNYSCTTGDMPILSVITAIPALSTWHIERRQAAHQNTDLVTGDKLPSGALENALDKLTRSLVDLRKQDWKSIHTPPDEQPTELTHQLPSIADRANNFFVWDSLGNPAADSESAPVGSVLFTDNGKSLVNTAYAGMRTLLGIITNKITKGGSLESGIQPANGTDPVDSQEILASSQPGRALMPSQPSVGLGRLDHEVAPEWRTPWVHPNSEVSGFRIIADPTDMTGLKFIVGVGVTQPFYVGHDSSTGGRTYASDGKDLRIDASLENYQGITKDAIASWSAGEGGGAAIDDFFPGSEYYVFVIGRKSDEVCDIALSLDFKGDDLTSMATIVAWAGGASNLLSRRIGILISDSTGQIRGQWQCGNWQYFKPINTMDTALLQNIDLPFTRIATATKLGNVVGPKEITNIRMFATWTPVAAGDLLGIRNNFDGSSAAEVDWDRHVKATGLIAGVAQTFEFTMIYDGLVPVLRAITNNASSSSLKVWQTAFYDTRGNSSKLLS